MQTVAPGADGPTRGLPQRPETAGLRVIGAWVVILLLAFGWTGLSSLRHPDDAPTSGSAPSHVSPESELGGRMMHNLVSWAKGSEYDQMMRKKASEGADPGDSATWIDRLAYAVLVAELDSPAEGLAKLEPLDPSAKGNDADNVLYATVKDSLQAWSQGEKRTVLPAAEAERLGWYANVLNDTVPPSNAAVVLITAVLWYGGFGLVGVLALLTLPILLLLGKILPKVEPSGRGAVYAETFAVWFLLFLSFQLGPAVVLQFLGLTGGMLYVAFVGMFASLVALAWPVLRGVPWSEVRRDIGLHAGRGAFVEILFGPLVYAWSLPLMAIGLVMYTWIRKHLLAGSAPPSHPIVEQFGGGASAMVPVVLLACVAAPIVEEIAFRGILYRHLRESRPLVGTALSILIAAGISSTLFAAIHPQGLAFVPVLAGLATGFCIAREVRGSLLPGMVAHAITNAATVSLGFFLFQN